MDPLLVPIFTALLAAAAAFGGGFLSHYSADQRERMARQAAFREAQLRQLYSPLLARLAELHERWALVSHLYTSQQQLIDQHNLQGQIMLDTIAKAQDFHVAQLQRQNEIFQELVQIMRDQFHLAEPSTRSHFRSVVRFFANREAVATVGVPIDATGEPIPGPGAPYPAAIQQFMLDIETQHNRIAEQLRTARYSELETSPELLVVPQQPPLLPDLNTAPGQQNNP